jgi:3-isopropylmalate/(R)-2-methylmalate dehydratase small subunit
MEKFTQLTAKACPLDVTNLNTDQLLPARYLKWPRSAGLGKVLFQDLRFDANGRERAEFPLNRTEWRDAKIIVAARNFGCGSSREAAVYALYDYGIRCVIAPSFGDIFSGNAVQNGLLTAIVTDELASDLMKFLNEKPQAPLSVDLERPTIQYGSVTSSFALEPSRRLRLLNGWDDVALTESFRDRVSAFKASDRKSRPWAAPPWAEHA